MKNNHESWLALANDLNNNGWKINGRVPLAGDIPHLIWLLGPMILAQKADARASAIEECAAIICTTPTCSTYERASGGMALGMALTSIRVLAAGAKP